MKLVYFGAILLALFSASGVSAEEGRRTLTIHLENKSPFPNRVQVRDLEARYGFPEDCRVAKKVAKLCDGDERRVLRPPPRGTNMTCAAALALVEETRCTVKDLIFDDWIDGEMDVTLTIHTDHDGFGRIAVRAVNNTDSWTIKPGLRDGDTVGHQ